MSNRVYNFYAGPATLPLSVLEQAQSELLDFQGTGMSVMEISHRSKAFDKVIKEAEADLKDLLGLGDDYRVLFLQGGASSQFYMVPMNFLPEGAVADYIITGSWSEKAFKEADKLGDARIIYSAKESNFDRIPDPAEVSPDDNAAYVHITSNNTIHGTQWQDLPDFGDIPLIADMSSDILSREFDASKFSLIYAGAQKNLGPAGVTIVIIRKSFLEKAVPPASTMLKYSTHVEKDSLYNTPPCFPIYMVGLVLKWLKAQGGIAAIEKQNKAKAGLIYDVIDSSNGFYKGHAQKDSRSMMNVTFNLADEDLEKAFVAAAGEQGFIGLKGHRSVGGIRASIYNAMPVEGCEKLAAFMREFQKQNS